MPRSTKATRIETQLLRWLPLLATAPSIAAVHSILRDVCSEVRGSAQYRLVWNDTATIDFPADPASTPNPKALQRLAAGSMVTHIDPEGQAWTLLPLLHGWLRGWLSLPTKHPKDKFLLPVAFQAAARLVTFGSDLRTAVQLQEIRAFDQSSSTGDQVELDPLLDELYVAVQRTLGAQHMYLALYDSASGLMRFAANFIHGKRAAKIQQWTMAQGLTGEVLRRGITIVTDDYLKACEEYGVQPLFMDDAPPSVAWLCVPLFHAETLIGVLTIYSDEPGVTYSAEYVSTLEVFAQWAAMTLERMRLYERTVQQTRQLELLNELGRTISSNLDLEAVPSLIMGRIQQIMDVEEGSLLLLDEDANDLVFSYSLSPFGRQLLGRRIPLTVGLAGLVVRTGQSLIVNRAQNHPAFYSEIDEVTGHETRDMLCVPLIGRKGVQGVVEIINRRDGMPFTPQDRALLEAVADQAVVALENAELYTRTDRALARRIQELDFRNKQLQEVVRVGNLIKAATDLHTALPQLSQAIRNSTGFNRIGIYLLEREPGLFPLLNWVAGVQGYSDEFDLPEPVQPSRVESLLTRGDRRGEATYYFDHAVNTEGLLLTTQPAPAEMPAARIGTWHPNDLLVTVLRASSGELLGLLTVEEPMDGLLPTAEQIQTLEIISNQLVVALENSRLYNQLRQNLQGVTALSALGMAINHQNVETQAIWQLTVGGIVDSSGALGAGVMLLSSDASPSTVLKLGRDHEPAPDLLDLARMVAARDRPLQLTTTDPLFPAAIEAAGGRSLLLLPLAGTHTTLGAVYMWYPALLPTPEEQDLVALFANQAAVAVENKLLAEAVREGRDRLASILASTEEAIMLINADMELMEVNAAAQRILAPAVEPRTRQPLLDTLSEWGTQNNVDTESWDELTQALEYVKNGADAEARGQFRCAGVRPRWFEWTALPVLSERAVAPYPSLLVLRDITAAMEIENLRQELTFMIIHDLRGPLGSILTSLDMLSKEMMGTVNEGQDKVLRIAMRSCGRLLGMVDLLLDISKLEAGQMPLSRVVTTFPAILRTVVQSYDALLTERKVKIKLHVADDLPPAWIDASTIDRVVQNLVDNAIKHSSSGGSITITAAIATLEQLPREHPAGEWLLISVHDEGPGIPAQFRERVFEKFAQVQKSGVKGTGLGLTYCRLAVEAHGGRIWVSDTDTSGSTFLFTIPIDSTGEPVQDRDSETTLEAFVR